MPIVEVSTRVAATPEAITTVLLDASLAPAWTAGLDHLEVVAGTPGEPGCVGRAHYIEGGRSHVLEDVLEQVEPARYFRSRLTGGGLTAVVETTLDRVGEHATDLTLRWTGRGTNPLTSFVLVVTKRRLAARARADLESLRRLVEDRHRQAGKVGDP